MGINPPRNAPPTDARVSSAIDRIHASSNASAARDRAERFDAKHNPARPDREKPDEGKVLARTGRDDGTELRVSLHTYEGKPFVRMGFWQRGRDGTTMWPVKGKGFTVRVRELGSVVKGLVAAMDDIDGDRG